MTNIPFFFVIFDNSLRKKRFKFNRIDTDFDSDVNGRCMSAQYLRLGEAERRTLVVDLLYGETIGRKTKKKRIRKARTCIEKNIQIRINLLLFSIRSKCSFEFFIKNCESKYFMKHALKPFSLHFLQKSN